MPNITKEAIVPAFGSRDNFIKLFKKFTEKGNIIVKTRKKQWFPKEISLYAKEIIDDDDKMYPTKISMILPRTYATVMFFSSGVYECVYGGNYVINIPLPLSRWSWNGGRMAQYFSINEGSLYQFAGAVESIKQSTILSPEWKFEPKKIDIEKRKEWINKFIGRDPASGAVPIVDDILKG